MANEVLLKHKSQIRFSGTGFSPADAGTDFTIGTPTVVSLTLADVADGAARQSAKADLGSTWAAIHECFCAIETETTPAPSATGTVDLYWAPSTHATAGNGNIAGNSGSDAACPDGALGSITLAEFLKQCLFIGSLFTHDAAATVQNGYVGRIRMPTQWGQMITVNNLGNAAAFHSDNVEMHIVLNAIADEIQ